MEQRVLVLRRKVHASKKKKVHKKYIYHLFEDHSWSELLTAYLVQYIQNVAVWKNLVFLDGEAAPASSRTCFPLRIGETEQR